MGRSQWTRRSVSCSAFCCVCSGRTVEKNQWSNWMLDMIDHTGGRIGIGELSEKAGYTRRQIDRKFADFVGLHRSCCVIY